MALKVKSGVFSKNRVVKALLNFTRIAVATSILCVCYVAIALNRSVVIEWRYIDMSKIFKRYSISPFAAVANLTAYTSTDSTKFPRMHRRRSPSMS